MKQKGVYPYDYIYSFNRFSEKKLPNKDNFYSILNDEHISDTQYVHAIKVWKTFKLKNMEEYHDKKVVQIEQETEVIQMVDEENVYLSDDEAEVMPATSKRHLQDLRKTMEESENRFKSSYTNFKRKILNALISPDSRTVSTLVNSLHEKRKDWTEINQYE